MKTANNQNVNREEKGSKMDPSEQTFVEFIRSGERINCACGRMVMQAGYSGGPIDEADGSPARRPFGSKQLYARCECGRETHVLFPNNTQNRIQDSAVRTSGTPLIVR